MIDLHVHTNFSDGQHSPHELIRMASERGIKTMAFADHMTLEGVSAGFDLAADSGIEFFSGVEFSTRYGEREYHLLLYGYNPLDDKLNDFLALYRQRLWDQAERLIVKFQSDGYELERSDFAEWGKAVPSGTGFFDALKMRNTQDARLAEYISGAKSFSPYLHFHRDFLIGELTPVMPDLIETIELFKDMGVLILAHPGYSDAPFLSILKEHGLDGIEVYSTYHDDAMSAALLNKARDLDLLVSAGSDYHGEKIKPGINIGDVRGAPDAMLLKRLRGEGKHL